MKITEDEFIYLMNIHEVALEDIRILKGMGICINEESEIYNALEEHLRHFSTLYFDKAGYNWIYWYFHKDITSSPESLVHLPDTISMLWDIVCTCRKDVK